MAKHYTHTYITHPQHKITVDIIGMGGTGSQVLTGLARINQGLMGLTHPGLHVRAWDDDIVTDANLGRQMFSPADINTNKAISLITRVNRFFGTEWEAMPVTYTGAVRSNILITCIDTAAGRIKIWERLQKKYKVEQPTDEAYYWLDLGNLQKTGQCVLGTLKQTPISGKDRKAKRSLKNIIQLFPQIKRIKEVNQGPSCSLAEALEKQDLFINSTLAQFGCNLLWKLIKEGSITHHGCYVNLESCIVNPIKI